jgi:hypothetical protein
MIASALLSCAKQKVAPGTASLTLFNAVPGSSQLVTNFTGTGTDSITWYKSALKLMYATWAANNQVSAYSGTQHLGIYQYPDTTSKSTPLYNLALDLPIGSIHTLFLTGTLTAPDTMFTTDVIPYHPFSDSSISFRFVNLSAGSSPISVNIKNNAYGSEVSSLSYKSITGFKNYPAPYNVTDYNFQIRDAASGTLLDSLDVKGINTSGSSSNIRRYRSFTIAFMGSPTDVTTRQITLIETYNSN